MRWLIRAFLAVPNALFRWSSPDWARRPVLLDRDAVCPELGILDEHFATIRAEYLAASRFVAEAPRYHEVDAVQTKISNEPGGPSWRAFFLESMGRKFHANRARLPRTAELIDRIPDVFQAFVSRLDPRKSVPFHASPYEGYVRYHLPLDVPRRDPPHMVVGGVEVHWREGEGVMFDDTYPHAVVNECDEPRTVLIVDVARPMNAIGRAAGKAVVALLRYTYARRIETRLANAWTV